MAEPIASDKCILILRPKDGSTHRAENYLRSRGWDVRVVLTVKEALTTISSADFLPGFAIIPVDHHEKNVTMLPGLLKQKFKAQIIAVFNRVPNNSAAILEKFKTQYALTSPVSGPSIERIVSKMKLEGDATASQSNADKNEKREKVEAGSRDSDGSRADPSRPEDKRNEKITIAGQKARKQEVQAPIQISRSLPINFSAPKQNEKRVPLIYQAGNRGSLLRAVQEAPKPARSKSERRNAILGSPTTSSMRGRSQQRTTLLTSMMKTEASPQMRLTPNSTPNRLTEARAAQANTPKPLPARSGRMLWQQILPLRRFFLLAMSFLLLAHRKRGPTLAPMLDRRPAPEFLTARSARFFPPDTGSFLIHTKPTTLLPRALKR